MAASLAEVDVETLGDTLSDVHTLVELLANTVAEVAPFSEGARLSHAQALVEAG